MTDEEQRFTGLVERHRRELRVHCYRMLGSFDESEDAVQEAFLRAWRSRATARGEFRAWLYRIATTTCLDLIDRRPGNRRTAAAGGAAPVSEVSWLQPCPDALLEDVADGTSGPADVAVSRETIELAFLAAVQHLPPRQRAVLVLRDVVGWRAAETAQLLDTSLASVNSALARARATMREQLPPRRADWTAATDAEERAVVRGLVAACDGGDLDAFAALLAENARQTMPPLPYVNDGRDAVLAAWRDVVTGPQAWGEWRFRPLRVNRQHAYATYLRPRREITFVDGSRAVPGPDFVSCNLNVVRLERGLVAEVTTFGAAVFPSLGLPGRV